MKVKHFKILRCRCGSRFTKLSQSMGWYWCLFCDAHISGCPNKGTTGLCKCQRVAA